MEKFFAPTQSSKDGAYRVRVVKSTKGVLGNLIEKTGFLKFESQEEADTAYATLEAGDVNLAFSDEATNGLYEINVIGLKSTVEHNI
jgi:hypothetical protein